MRPVSPALPCQPQCRGKGVLRADRPVQNCLGLQPFWRRALSYRETWFPAQFFSADAPAVVFFARTIKSPFKAPGTRLPPRELFRIAKALVDKGVHNLNFVTPDHFWPHIRQLCLKLREADVAIPFIYNCSGYALPEIIDAVAEVIDIFLPDFKFADPDLAGLCMHAPHYPEIATEALAHMVAAKGFLTPWDPSGNRTACRGVLVRQPGPARPDRQQPESDRPFVQGIRPGSAHFHHEPVFPDPDLP